MGFRKRWLVVWVLIGLLGGAPAGAAEMHPAENAAGERALSLRRALALGIARNLDLKLDELQVPIRREEVTAGDAVFDPALEASVFSRDSRRLTGSIFVPGDTVVNQETGGSLGVRKKFVTGLESRLSLESARLEDNSLVNTLAPEYRSMLVLNLTQPLFKDFGIPINTTELRLARNRVSEAVMGYLGRARQIGLQVELAYYELALAESILQLRISSRRLADELLQGNRERFEQGMVSVSEVDEARAARVGRQEAVIAALQKVEIAENRLKDLLEIRIGDPLHAVRLTTVPLSDTEVDFPSRNAALTRARQQRMELQRIQVNLDNQEIRLDFLRNQTLPRLDMNATVGLNGLSGGDRGSRVDPTRPTLLEGEYGDSWDRMLAGDGYEWSVGLRFSYPLGNRAAEARYSQGRIEKRRIAVLIQRVEGQIETEVQNALVSVNRSRERVAVAREFERLAQKTLSQEMERLQMGLSDTFRVLDFQDKLVEARIRAANAVVDFHRGLAGLYRAIGDNLKRHDIVAAFDGAVLDEVFRQDISGRSPGPDIDARSRTRRPPKVPTPGG